MKTLFKYIFYLLLIAILYIVISAMYNGDMNSSTTVGEVGNQIKTGAEKMVSDTAKVVEKGMNE